jgi:uncharacterized membrane protein (DUF2068 family)
LIGASRNRPYGVTIIAVLNFLAAALLLISIVANMVSPPADSASISIDNSDPFAKSLVSTLDAQQQRQVYISTCVSLFGIVLTVAIGVGLWKLQAWGRNLALSFFGLCAVLALCSSLSKLVLLVSVAVIVYLFSPQAREAFVERPFLDMQR